MVDPTELKLLSVYETCTYTLELNVNINLSSTFVIISMQSLSSILFYLQYILQ